MEFELTTKRLPLRPLSIDDIGLVVEGFADGQVMKYAGGRIPKEKVIEEIEMHTRRGGNGFLGVWCISDKIPAESLDASKLKGRKIHG